MIIALHLFINSIVLVFFSLFCCFLHFVVVVVCVTIFFLRLIVRVDCICFEIVHFSLLFQKSYSLKMSKMYCFIIVNIDVYFWTFVCMFWCGGVANWGRDEREGGGMGEMDVGIQSERMSTNQERKTKDHQLKKNRTAK